MAYIWLNQIELEDPLENVGVKLVRQAGAKTNDLAGDGCTTSIVLARGLIAEGAKVWIMNGIPIFEYGVVCLSYLTKLET